MVDSEYTNIRVSLSVHERLGSFRDKLEKVHPGSISLSEALAVLLDKEGV